MEQIVRESIYPEAARRLPRRGLPPLLLVVFIMVAGFATVSIGVRMVAQYTPPVSDPFLSYADIFPGQPMSAVEARMFSCVVNSNTYYAPTEAYDLKEKSCTFAPVSGVFSSVEVVVYEGIVRQTNFIVRENMLKVGDLQIFLKMPTLHSFYRTAYLFLPERFVIARTANYPREFSLFLSVWTVSFISPIVPT